MPPGVRTLPSGPPAANQSYQPDDGEHHDDDPQQVDQTCCRVEQEPHNEKDYRNDEE